MYKEPHQAGVSPDGRIFSFCYDSSALRFGVNAAYHSGPSLAVGKVRIDSNGWPVVTNIKSKDDPYPDTDVFDQWEAK
jgi:hypothetical protein